MKTRKAKRDLYQEITDKVIAALEAGTAPWRCPWDRSGEIGLPMNHKTGDGYKGINIAILWMTQQEQGFSSGRWLTYKQAAELGGQVRKGEKGTTAIFYKPLERETGEIDPKTGEAEIERIPMIRAFTLFNLDQIQGIERPEVALAGRFDPLPKAEQALQASGVAIHEGGTRAFYRPSTDEITMPDRERFELAMDYYATALHELTHATKHKSRCNRKPYESKAQKGAYAFEELVAELGAMFTMATLGLAGEVQDHAAYIDSWLSVLREDKRAIFKAAAQAQQAHEWIMEASKPFSEDQAA